MIIGITGTIAAGKGTIVEFLKSKGFEHLSVRGYLTEEIKKRSLKLNRDSMVMIANELREKYSPSYIVEELMKKAKRDTVIESIRAIGEVKSLQKNPEFVLFAVDAPKEERYKRAIARKSVTDNVTFEEFVAKEDREMTNDDPNKQNLRACIKMADFIFYNDEKIEDLHKNVERVINELRKKN